MHLDVLVIGHGVQQPQDVFASLRVEAVQQHGVCGAILPFQLQLGIVYNDE